MPSAIQAVYFDSEAPGSGSLDKSAFRIVEADGGVYVQTAPVPNTFALHHLRTLGTLALAISDRDRDSPKTAPPNFAFLSQNWKK